MGSREVLDFCNFLSALPGFFSAFERALVMASSSYLERYTLLSSE